MTNAERIKRIAEKAGVPYSVIKNMIYSTFGNKINLTEEDRLKLLEKHYNL